MGQRRRGYRGGRRRSWERVLKAERGITTALGTLTNAGKLGETPGGAGGNPFLYACCAAWPRDPVLLVISVARPLR